MVDNMGQISFTPAGKIWSSMHWISHNMQPLSDIVWGILYWISPKQVQELWEVAKIHSHPGPKYGCQQADCYEITLA